MGRSGWVVCEGVNCSFSENDSEFVRSGLCSCTDSTYSQMVLKGTVRSAEARNQCKKIQRWFLNDSPALSRLGQAFICHNYCYLLRARIPVCQIAFHHRFWIVIWTCLRCSYLLIYALNTHTHQQTIECVVTRDI